MQRLEFHLGNGRSRAIHCRDEIRAVVCTIQQPRLCTTPMLCTCAGPRVHYSIKWLPKSDYSTFFITYLSRMARQNEPKRTTRNFILKYFTTSVSLPQNVQKFNRKTTRREINRELQHPRKQAP